MADTKIERIVTDLRRYVVDAASGCWNWVGAKLRSGHGAVRVGGQTKLAHRVFYEHLVGPIAAGLLAHHICKNPRCVNPRHIRPVTAAEHARIHAELHGKIDLNKAREIRRLWQAGGLTQGQIASMYGIDHSTVSRVVRNETWPDVSEPDELPKAA